LLLPGEGTGSGTAAGAVQGTDDCWALRRWGAAQHEPPPQLDLGAIATSAAGGTAARYITTLLGIS